MCSQTTWFPKPRRLKAETAKEQSRCGSPPLCADSRPVPSPTALSSWRPPSPTALSDKESPPSTALATGGGRKKSASCVRMRLTWLPFQCTVRLLVFSQVKSRTFANTKNATGGSVILATERSTISTTQVTHLRSSFNFHRLASVSPNPHWIRARKFVGNSFDVACVQCEHSHSQQQVLYTCVCTSRPVKTYAKGETCRSQQYKCVGTPPPSPRPSAHLPPSPPDHAFFPCTQKRFLREFRWAESCNC